MDNACRKAALKICYHQELVTEEETAWIRGWLAADPRMKFCNESTRLVETVDNMKRVLCNLLDCTVAELKTLHKCTSEPLLKAKYRDQMALWNINPAVLLRSETHALGAETMNAVRGKRKPLNGAPAPQDTIAKVVKMEKHLKMHNILNAEDRLEAITQGKALKKLVSLEFDPLPPHEQDELLLIFLMWWSNRVAYCRQPYTKRINEFGVEVEVTPLITRHLQGPMCTMHGNGLRMSEQVLTRLAQHVEDSHDLSRAEKDGVCVELARALNDNIGSDTNISIKLDETGKIGLISMSAVKMMKQIETFATVLVPIAFSLAHMNQSKRLLFEEFGHR
jgi:hypothetical protein